MAAAEPKSLRDMAARVGRLAQEITDERARRALTELAAEYEARAAAAEANSAISKT